MDNVEKEERSKNTQPPLSTEELEEIFLENFTKG